MTWKKHPGIWFTLYSFALWFWLSLLLTVYHVKFISAIMVGVSALLFYFVVYYHARWMDKLTGDR